MLSLLLVFSRGLGEPNRFPKVQGLLKWHLGGLHWCLCLSTDLTEADGVASVNWCGATRMNANLLILYWEACPQNAVKAFTLQLAEEDSDIHFHSQWHNFSRSFASSWFLICVVLFLQNAWPAVASCTELLLFQDPAKNCNYPRTSHPKLAFLLFCRVLSN